VNWIAVLPYLHYTVFLIEIALIVTTLYFSRKDPLNRVTAALMLCFAFWTFILIFQSNPDAPGSIVLLLYYALAFAWIFPAALILWFAHLITEKIGVLKRPFFYFTVFLPAVFFLAAFYTGNVRTLPEHFALGWYVGWKPGFFTYAFYAYYLVYCGSTVFMLWNYSRKNKNPTKKRLSAILYSTALASLFVSTFIEFFMPRNTDFSRMFSNTTNLFVVFFVLGIFYLIFRYNLLIVTPQRAANDIINNMSEALLVLDEYFNITFYNNAALELLRVKGDELSGRPFISLFSEMQRFSEWFSGTARGRRFRSFETRLARKDGSQVPSMISSSVIYTDTAVTGIICVISDISLQKQSEQEIQKSYEKLQELDKMKNNFLSIVSHELRTPLTSIIGYISLLLNGAAGRPDARQLEFMEPIQHNSRRLLSLINELLDVSKMGAGSFSISKSHADLVAITNESILDIKSIAEKKKIILKFESDVSTMTIRIDGPRISQSIINIISNSLKFSPVESTITIKLEAYDIKKHALPAEISQHLLPERRYAFMSFTDKGSGMNKEDLGKLFTRFFQAEDADTRKTSGTGLGLYIVKSIIDLHDGFIWPESDGKGKGTSIKILLPED
jgi:PAS domain S-box-containing protein